jgi:hypothetical protein
MAPVLSLLKSWILVNWKTTVLGVVAGVEVYQQTHNLSLALTTALAGLFASDGKASHALPAP